MISGSYRRRQGRLRNFDVRPSGRENSWYFVTLGREQMRLEDIWILRFWLQSLTVYGVRPASTSQASLFAADVEAFTMLIASWREQTGLSFLPLVGGSRRLPISELHHSQSNTQPPQNKDHEATR